MIVALIWDFDNTLIKGCMQEPIFAAYGVDGARFWHEKDELEKRLLAQGLRVNRDMLYLVQFIQWTKNGTFSGLNNAAMQAMGARQAFCPGIPEFFARARTAAAAEGVKLENYIVSNGMAAVIRGSSVAAEADGIWGCELADGPDGEIADVVYALDNTAKTRVIYEINKGPDVDVNTRVPREERRIPFKNMIYIGDGQSDIPAFSLISKNGGVSIGVYHPEQPATFPMAQALLRDGRICAHAVADYRAGGEAGELILQKMREIACKAGTEKRR